MFLLTALVLLLGLMLIDRGWRGRAIDDHPVCRQCRFDLFGRAQGSHVCPECGAILSTMTIDIGNRTRRDGMIAAGGAVLLAGFVLAGSLIPSVRNFDASRFKPDWWLLHDARLESSRYCPRPNSAQLLYRVKVVAVSARTQRKIVATALALQADRKTPWNPAWGDMVECLKSNGQLPAEDWQTYLAQIEFATMEVRPNCSRGYRIPFTLSGELRGATPMMPGRAGNGVFPHYTGGVPGVLSYLSWGGTAGSTIQTNGNVYLPPQSWQSLKPGVNSLSVTISALGSYDEKNPALFGNLTCRANWTLLPDGQKSVQLYRDEVVADSLQKRLRHSMTTCSTGDVTIQIHFDHPPVDVALDVFLRSGSSEWKSDFPLMATPTQDLSGSIFTFSHTSQLSGQHVDVILRPSIEAASNTMNLNRLLDHEFVLNDVLFSSNSEK